MTAALDTDPFAPEFCDGPFRHRPRHGFYAAARRQRP